MFKLRWVPVAFCVLALVACEGEPLKPEANNSNGESKPDASVITEEPGPLGLDAGRADSGSEDAGEPDAGITPPAYCAEFVRRSCAREVECGFISSEELPRCETAMREICQKDVDDFQAGVRGFIPEKVVECLDTLLGRVCGGSLLGSELRFPPVCYEAFPPTSELGSSCGPSTCKTGVCNAEPGSCGTCQPLSAEGQPCGAGCEAGLRCSSGVCQRRKVNGDACQVYYECPNFECEPGPDGGNICSFPKPLGAPCRANSQCQSNTCLMSVSLNDAGRPEYSGVCGESTLELGAVCEFENACLPGLWCRGFSMDVTLPQRSGICAPLIAPGAPCTSNDRCALDKMGDVETRHVCLDGFCKPTMRCAPDPAQPGISGVCREVGQQPRGAECSFEAFNIGFHECEQGLFCLPSLAADGGVTSRGRCAQPQDAGTDCLVLPYDGTFFTGRSTVDMSMSQCRSSRCVAPDAGLRDDTYAMMGECTPRASAGMPCQLNYDCLPLLSCVKAQPGDVLGQCAEAALPGEDCASPGVRCQRSQIDPHPMPCLAETSTLADGGMESRKVCAGMVQDGEPCFADDMCVTSRCVRTSPVPTSPGICAAACY